MSKRTQVKTIVPEVAIRLGPKTANLELLIPLLLRVKKTVAFNSVGTGASPLIGKLHVIEYLPVTGAI
ncbi:hypothetical protein ELI64_30475 [Klebsiella pneumoniae]|nr:hypothetical protein [Klebsiella pneumoniae]